MSIESWKRTFYRVPAAEVPKDEAIAHSLRKWRGLIASARKKHKVVRYSTSLKEKGDSDAWATSFHVDSKTCALCVHFFDEANCDKCPLAIVRGGVPCDKPTKRERTPPYLAWDERGDPMPMIRWLEKAEKWRAEQKAEGK